MDERQQPASGSTVARRYSSTPSNERRSAIESVMPATRKEIAVELQKLRAVFGYEETAWQVAADLYFDALADVPYDLLAYAVATYIRLAGSDTRFPKPGQLRFLVSDRLSDRQRDAARASRQPQTEEWPEWLADLWGPAPAGPIKRAAAGKAQEDAYHEAALWRQHGRPLLPQGMKVSDWIASGMPEEIRGQRVQFAGRSGRPPISEAEAMRQLREELGVKSQEEAT